MSLPKYAELLALSCFSFLKGASRPSELVERAKAMGYSAIAVVDECSMAGIVRAYEAARDTKMRLLIGAHFQVDVDGTQPFRLAFLAETIEGYGDLCEFITKLRRASDEKGIYRLALPDIDPSVLRDLVAIVVPDRESSQDEVDTAARWLAKAFSGRCWLGVSMLRLVEDEAWLRRMRLASATSGVPLVAVGDAHMHVRSRKALQDVMTAIRLCKPLTECGLDLQPNAEQHLRTRLRLGQTFSAELLAETLVVMERCKFTLDELKYQYPDEVVPPGETPTSYLRKLTYEGAGRRWPQGMPEKVQTQIEHELGLIGELRYEHYFLTVADIVMFARSQHILCQGRGSAANSVVCYCLGVTEVDPARMSVLFERFISKERGEPPDIDVDFEHERREEVIQYLYRKYGRHRAALTAVQACYRSKSSVRDVGKALGFEPEILDAAAKNLPWFEGREVMALRFQEVGIDVDSLAGRQLMAMVEQIIDMPRHLSQHPGGFVLTRGPLSRMVPIENAAMPDRTVIQWDKDDLDVLGLLKVDVLALGMLTAIRKSLAFISDRKSHVFEMQDIPPEDDATYDMICEADTLGVFQIESRAQMSMLPRMRPRCFYDLVIEVAIVRPGPIQGGMVHPLLARREGKEPVTYPNPALKEALGRTMGVPVFQEQVMQLAIIAAGFSPGEADALRRSMAAWRRKGGLEKYHAKIVEGMSERGYEVEFAESIFRQIQGFSEYGFPESHAASFALLVYASCWIKKHHPAEFLAAMLNSQPLGFYSPSQLMQDAKRHGIEVRPIDAMSSGWDCALEGEVAPPAVRLGFRLVSGMKEASARRIEAARAEALFDSADDLARRALLQRDEMTLLAAADALATLSGHRRAQVWEASALRAAPQLLRDAQINEEDLELPEAPEGEAILWDYNSTGLTLRRHPLALLRPQLWKRGYLTAKQLEPMGDGVRVQTCGIVTLRQQPETAKGVIFVSLEDETGVVQVICWRSIKEAQREELLRSRLLGVHGKWQREGSVRNLIAHRLEDLSHLMGRLGAFSRDFK